MKCYPNYSEDVFLSHAKSVLKLLQTILGLACILIYRLGGSEDFLHITKELKINDGYVLCLVTFGAFIIFSGGLCISYFMGEKKFHHTATDLFGNFLGVILHWASAAIILNNWNNEPDDIYKKRAIAMSSISAVNGFLYLIETALCAYKIDFKLHLGGASSESSLLETQDKDKEQQEAGGSGLASTFKHQPTQVPVARAGDTSQYNAQESPGSHFQEVKL